MYCVLNCHNAEDAPSFTWESYGSMYLPLVMQINLEWRGHPDEVMIWISEAKVSPESQKNLVHK
jgi:hypothetical protein